MGSPPFSELRPSKSTNNPLSRQIPITSKGHSMDEAAIILKGPIALRSLAIKIRAI